MIRVAKLAHRKSRWKLRKIIAQSKSTNLKEGTEDSERKIIAIGRIRSSWTHAWICQSLHVGKLHNRRKGPCEMLRPITFSEYLGYKAILWNFQCVKRVDKHVDQDDVRKVGVERQNSKKGFRMFLWFRIAHLVGI